MFYGGFPYGLGFGRQTGIAEVKSYFVVIVGIPMHERGHAGCIAEQSHATVIKQVVSEGFTAELPGLGIAAETHQDGSAESAGF